MKPPLRRPVEVDEILVELLKLCDDDVKRPLISFLRLASRYGLYRESIEQGSPRALPATVTDRVCIQGCLDDVQSYLMRMNLYLTQQELLGNSQSGRKSGVIPFQLPAKSRGRK